MEEELTGYEYPENSSWSRQNTRMMKGAEKANKICLKALKPGFKFMLWHGLSLRRKSTIVQQDLHRLIDKLLSYFLQVRRLSQSHEYQPSCIRIMD